MGGVWGRRNRRIALGRALLAIPAVLATTHAASAAAQAAQAEAPSAAAAPSQARCELHVWPADTTHTTFQGWIHAGAVDGARRGVKGYPDLHADALDTEEQARLLATIDWRAAFNDPTLVVTVHTTPTGSANDRSRTSRLVLDDSSPCYRELIISSSILESEVFSARSVRILALRKRFDGADATPANFSSMSQTAVVFSDADKAAADAGTRMDAAVQAAFVSAVSKFAVMQSFH